MSVKATDVSKAILSSQYKGMSFDTVLKASKGSLFSRGKGDPSAQYWVAFKYYEGSGVSRNMDQAIIWFEKAANQGIPDAQYMLGEIYLENAKNCKNVEDKATNLDTAKKWYKMAAQQGHSDAIVMLDVMGIKYTFYLVIIFFT